MTKHFRATHKETGEQIEFGLEDISTASYYDHRDVYPVLILGRNLELTDYPPISSSDVLKDYDLEYSHKGEWFKYEL